MMKRVGPLTDARTVYEYACPRCRREGMIARPSQYPDRELLCSCGEPL